MTHTIAGKVIYIRRTDGVSLAGSLSEAREKWYRENHEALDAIKWDSVDELINAYLPEGFYAKIEDS